MICMLLIYSHWIINVVEEPLKWIVITTMHVLMYLVVLYEHSSVLIGFNVRILSTARELILHVRKKMQNVLHALLTILIIANAYNHQRSLFMTH